MFMILMIFFLLAKHAWTNLSSQACHSTNKSADKRVCMCDIVLWSAPLFSVIKFSVSKTVSVPPSVHSSPFISILSSLLEINMRPLICCHGRCFVSWWFVSVVLETIQPNHRTTTERQTTAVSYSALTQQTQTLWHIQIQTNRDHRHLCTPVCV